MTVPSMPKVRAALMTMAEREFVLMQSYLKYSKDEYFKRWARSHETSMWAYLLHWAELS